jgi:hypothetical protein
MSKRTKLIGKKRSPGEWIKNGLKEEHREICPLLNGEPIDFLKRTMIRVSWVIVLFMWYISAIVKLKKRRDLNLILF